MTNATSPFVQDIAARIGELSSRFGDPVFLDQTVLDRSDSFSLSTPGLWSANRSCRLIEAQDGWIAVNLPREDDRLAVPALLESASAGDAWEVLAAHADRRVRAELVARAELFGVALTAVGETPAPRQPCSVVTGPRARRRGARLRVVDFSSLWAGPLAAAIFARMGADVVRIQCVNRPDPTARVAPLLDQRLNGGKRQCSIALASQAGLAKLLEEISLCDVLITNGRARGLEALGLCRERLLARNPSLIWIAITGHGWASNRIGFGDDCAAAGGLLAWDEGTPQFSADALADPLTGMAGAAAALDLLAQGRGGFVDAALAQTAAAAATHGRA